MNRNEMPPWSGGPSRRQLEFMRRPEPEALYGGAAGGGKSDALVIEALRQVHIPHYRALILRKTFPATDATLWTRASCYYRRAFPEAQYNATSHVLGLPQRGEDLFRLACSTPRTGRTIRARPLILSALMS